MASGSKRSKYFDNAKLFLIFLVVFGHLISPLKQKDGFLYTLYTVIYLFHMPAFIFISGYFSKGFNKKGQILKLAKKLLIPYILFQAIYSVFYYLNGMEDSLYFDWFHPHWSLWFLLSMFSWHVLLHFFARFRWIGLGVAVIIGAAAGYFDNIGSYLSLSRTFVFFPYFFLGFLVNSSQLRNLLRNKFSIPASCMIIISTVLIFSVEFPKDAVPWLLGDSSYAAMGGEQVYDGLFRVMQYLLTIIVVFGFLTFIPAAQFKLTEIGERTLYIYLLHGFIIKSIQTLFPDKHVHLFLGHYIVLMLLAFVICLGLGSYLVKKFTRPLVEPNLTLGSSGN